MITDISKKMIVAVILFGSLSNISTIKANTDATAQEEKPSELRNFLHWGAALAIGGSVFYITVNHGLKKGLVPQSTLEKAAHWLLAVPRFVEEHKNPIQVTTAAVILARYGKSSFNSLTEGLRYHNIKQPFPNPWLGVPVEKSAKKHHKE